MYVRNIDIVLAQVERQLSSMPAKK